MSGRSENLERWEVIIVGAGAAGAASALALRGCGILMLDVGLEPPARTLPAVPMAELARNEDLRKALVGESFDSFLAPDERDLTVKLKAPAMRFVSNRPSELPKDEYDGFYSIQSFSKGGLANAWGAGVMRFTESELRHFPLSVSEVDPWFDFLTEHIGISGSSADDLTGYFGSAAGLLPPLPLCALGDRFVARYNRRRAFLNDRGLTVGRPRLAVLSKAFRGRERYRTYGQEFFSAPHEGIYSPAFTIDELRREGSLQYRPGVLVEKFSQDADGVTVYGRDLATGQSLTFAAQELVLAAGALNSSRIVLTSAGDFESKLPLLDNPVSFLPFIDIQRIGIPLAVDAFVGAELSVLLSDPADPFPTQGSLYNLMGPLRTDLLKEFPLSFKGNLTATRELVPAILMIQLFYPDLPNPANYLQLLPSGGLRMVRGLPGTNRLEPQLASLLRRMGYAAFASLAKRPISGSSIHYAGTMPMRAGTRKKFETDLLGRFDWANRVSVADASTFPVLPAKNLTFMAMANACRMADAVRRRLGAVANVVSSNS